MYIRSWEHADEEEYSAWQHQWVPLDSISPYMAVAVMASEDQRFLKHHGFDLKPSSKHKLNLKKEDADAAQVPSANRQPKMCFYGQSLHG